MTARWIPGWVAVALATAAVVTASAGAPVPPAWTATLAGGVPPEIVAHFAPEDVARGRAYMCGRYWLFAAGTLLRLALLAFLVLTTASAALRNLAVRLTPAHPAVAVAIYTAILVAAFELLALPLGYYAGFVREHAFGLSTQGAAAWLLDRLKGAALSLTLAIPLVSLLAWLWRRYPGRWVFPAWVLCGVTIIVLAAVAPIVIDPLFNTIKPLPDAGLRQRVLTLAGRAGIAVEQVYEADASRRTKKSNAYFTGLGATKRIVLYDNLVTRSDPDVVELVVAHEMGHWKHAHLWQGVALALGGVAALLWCGARVLAWAAERRLFHLAGPADVAGLPLFLLVLFALSLLSLPIQNVISRHFERQADWTSLELTSNPAAFIRAEVDLARANFADLTPPRPVVWLLYTHPPVVERIRMADAFSREHPLSFPR